MKRHLCSSRCVKREIRPLMVVCQGVMEFKGHTNPNDIVCYMLDAEQRGQYDGDWDLEQFKYLQL